jgi:hypothetical protein
VTFRHRLLNLGISLAADENGSSREVQPKEKCNRWLEPSINSLGTAEVLLMLTTSVSLGTKSALMAGLNSWRFATNDRTYSVALDCNVLEREIFFLHQLRRLESSLPC